MPTRATQYGASFLAHLVTAKCVDSIPLYRLEKDFKRQGVPVGRSTMNDLFHRAADITAPVSARLLELIRHREVVLADETRMRMQDGGDGKPKRSCRNPSLILSKESKNRPPN